jgi:hypothetical protein
MSFNKWLQISIVMSFCLLIPLGTEGAVLYLEPSGGEYQPGDSFMVELKIDTEEECINAVEASLSFSRNILKAVDFSQGKSIITLWVKSPEINQEKGEISFSGGIPGGYCGRIPGDPGSSNLLGEIIFRIPGMMVREPGENTAEVKFSDTSQILLNDGLGTKAKLTSQGAVFEILSKSEPSLDEWQEEIEKDIVPPEPFEIEVNQEPSIFEGKYFITFSTTDKQTGLDYYEVKEGEGDWKEAKSPYLLEDQGLESIIKVKAVDKAGNERIAEYLPEIPEKPFPYWIIILVLTGVGIWLIIRRFKYGKK